jgi:glucosamine--fructose-6-phosphate aminotransferase (isomerizing)
MCGVVGYIGNREALPIILSGLKRLEYRGYDSSGVAIHDGKDNVIIQKEKGKIIELEKLISDDTPSGTLGICHTRWATHGEPSQLNAHPHQGYNQDIILVHNGIIENYNELRIFLREKDYKFYSDTDTEVLASLVDYYYQDEKNLDKAVRKALRQVEGAYGIAVLDKNNPNELVAARKGSPLIIGIGKNEYFIASDVAAIIDSTRDVIYLQDGEMAILTRDSFSVKTIGNKLVDPEIQKVHFELEAVEKGGFDHFMLKEIFEQPTTIFDTYRGRTRMDEGIVQLGGLVDHMDRILNARRIVVVACGTSWHAALYAEYILEHYTKIPVEVDYASEFRYRGPILNEQDVVIVISQSGETADTLAALREAKRHGALTLGVVNVVGSSIAREVDAGMYTHAGPEIGVASTKAFTSQVTIFILMAIMISRKKNMSSSVGIKLLSALKELPRQVEKILKQADEIKKIALEVYTKDIESTMFLGRGFNFPTALEGALKLKEISYIHAEGYPSAEMKHGPIALIHDKFPVITITTKDTIYEKVVSNVEEIKARKGIVVAIATEGDTKIGNLADHVIYIPQTLEALVPLLAIIPLQLLSYYVAVDRGCDVDQPRNLAKSVTVE